MFRVVSVGNEGMDPYDVILPQVPGLPVPLTNSPHSLYKEPGSCL